MGTYPNCLDCPNCHDCSECPYCNDALPPTRSVSVMSSTPNVEAVLERSELDGWKFVALEALYGTLIKYTGPDPISEFRADQEVRVRAGETLIGVSLMYRMDE